MDILTVADCHGQLRERDLLKTLSGRKPDAVFFLGDNDADDIECVQEYVKKIPMFGVIGNHDYLNILEDYHIENLHRKVVNYDGFLLGGFGGTIKYKEDSSRLMFTNEESESILAGFPKVDILITHDRPCFQSEKIKTMPEQEEPMTLFQKIRNILMPKRFQADDESEQTESEYEPAIMTAHSGLTGIAQYIQDKRPDYVLHGHMHIPNIEVRNRTTIQCCFRTEYLTLNKKRF